MKLFGNKEENTYTLPPKLEMLLKMAIEDGAISEKELAVLRAEAQKHDISDDELDMIIESRVNKQKPSSDTQSKSTVTSEEMNTVINNNLYSSDDSIAQTFQKYETLCDYTDKKLEKHDREKLHRAQLAFINSIVSPDDKQSMLDLIAHTLPYTKKDLSSKALKTVTNIGFFALKAVSVTAKVATVGLAGKAVDNLEQLAQQAIVRNAEELANAWQNKAECLLSDAKELAGGLFSGDRQFKSKLAELAEQYKNNK